MKLHKIILAATRNHNLENAWHRQYRKKTKFCPDLLPSQLITRRCDEITLFLRFLICDMFLIDNV